MSSQSHEVRDGGWKESLCVGLIVFTGWTACFRFPVVWQWIGVGKGDRPFFDLYGLLASGERAQAGFDAFQLNPLDPYHRPHVYTEWCASSRKNWPYASRRALARGKSAPDRINCGVARIEAAVP